MMTDDVLLQQIRKIVNEEVKAVELRLSEKIEKVDSKLISEIKVVESTLRSSIEKTEQKIIEKIDEVKESVEIVQEVMVKHNGILEIRVKKLEETVDIPRR